MIAWFGNGCVSAQECLYTEKCVYVCTCASVLLRSRRRHGVLCDCQVDQGNTYASVALGLELVVSAHSSLDSSSPLTLCMPPFHASWAIQQKTNSTDFQWLPWPSFQTRSDSLSAVLAWLAHPWGPTERLSPFGLCKSWPSDNVVPFPESPLPLHCHFALAGVKY